MIREPGNMHPIHGYFSIRARLSFVLDNRISIHIIIEKEEL